MEEEGAAFGRSLAMLSLVSFVVALDFILDSEILEFLRGSVFGEYTIKAYFGVGDPNMMPNHSTVPLSSSNISSWHQIHLEQYRSDYLLVVSAFYKFVQGLDRLFKCC